MKYKVFATEAEALPEDSLSDIETLLPKPFAANLKDKDFIVNDGWFPGGEI